MESITEKRVLVCGASMAGLSTALWMNKLGYKVTVVELAAEPRTAGGAVNIEGDAATAVKRMGIFEQLKASRLQVETILFKNADDVTAGSMIVYRQGDALPDDDIEIERDRFVHILLEAINNEVEFIFNDSITALHESAGGMQVTFKNGPAQLYHLVFGCDGMHSAVRRIWFGPEAAYTHFLGGYFSISIMDKLLVRQKTMEMYNEPNKGIMLNAYNNKTDIIFAFNSDKEIPYDYRDEAQQRKIIAGQFTGMGWRTAELLGIVQHSENFYFDKFCQIKMPSWTKGRVALVGDAGYCASPAAGKGASLSVTGATTLADALVRQNGNYKLAFENYNQNLRPFIEVVQAKAELNVREIIPRTVAVIRKRNTSGFLNV